MPVTKEINVEDFPIPPVIIHYECFVSMRCISYSQIYFNKESFICH